MSRKEFADMVNQMARAEIEKHAKD